mmetsp:Transcript_36364/g.46302  ORF Transcript_36364/g.46302 Transcript_36364/m.46302 type:complete len:297 (+) Transcript_36364:118-1008(+)
MVSFEETSHYIVPLNETDILFVDTSTFEYLYILMGFLVIGGLLGLFCCFHYVKTLNASQEQKRVAVRRAWQEFKEKKDAEKQRKRKRKKMRKKGTATPDAVPLEDRRSVITDESMSSRSSQPNTRSTLRTFLSVLSQGLPVDFIADENKVQKVKFWYKDLSIRWQKQKSKSTKFPMHKVTSVKLKDIKEVQISQEGSNRSLLLTTKGNKRYSFEAQSTIERDAVVQGLNLMLTNIPTVSLLQETLSDISVRSTRSLDSQSQSTSGSAQPRSPREPSENEATSSTYGNKFTPADENV